MSKEIIMLQEHGLGIKRMGHKEFDISYAPMKIMIFDSDNTISQHQNKKAQIKLIWVLEDKFTPLLTPKIQTSSNLKSVQVQTDTCNNDVGVQTEMFADNQEELNTKVKMIH